MAIDWGNDDVGDFSIIREELDRFFTGKITLFLPAHGKAIIDPVEGTTTYTIPREDIAVSIPARIQQINNGSFYSTAYNQTNQVQYRLQVFPEDIPRKPSRSWKIEVVNGGKNQNLNGQILDIAMFADSTQAVYVDFVVTHELEQDQI